MIPKLKRDHQIPDHCFTHFCFPVSWPPTGRSLHMTSPVAQTSGLFSLNSAKRRVLLHHSSRMCSFESRIISENHSGPKTENVLEPNHNDINGEIISWKDNQAAFARSGDDYCAGQERITTFHKCIIFLESKSIAFIRITLWSNFL